MLVPPAYQLMVADAYKGKKQFLLRAEANHNSPMSAGDESQLQGDLDWLWAHRMP
jgi:hypothetical protein